ncbi:NBS-LRR resistance protein, partial [Trifolium medium]|nr:NBS-LRR resistance protein [Trifolium medium]
VLPNELNSLSSLQELHILGCIKLESLSECVLQGLSSLQVLRFSYCGSLKSLPEGMKNLTCLESLGFSFCSSLKSLPKDMNKLTSLRQLTISGGDKNGTLPNGLEGIPSLRNLYLDFLDLVTMPDWLGTMTSLQTLEIKWCSNLTSLPDSFKELKNLHELRISNCPMLENKCKKETGEEWHKIAHVPELELELESTTVEPEPSFYEEMMSLWKKPKQFWQKKPTQFWLNDDYDEFDKMVDDVTNAELINR